MSTKVDGDSLDEDLAEYNQAVMAQYIAPKNDEDKPPVVFEDVIRAFYRIQSGVIRTAASSASGRLSAVAVIPISARIEQIINRFRRRVFFAGLLMSIRKKQRSCTVIGRSAMRSSTPAADVLHPPYRSGGSGREIPSV